MLLLQVEVDSDRSYAVACAVRPGLHPRMGHRDRPLRTLGAYTLLLFCAEENPDRSFAVARVAKPDLCPLGGPSGWVTPANGSIYFVYVDFAQWQTPTKASPSPAWSDLAYIRRMGHLGGSLRTPGAYTLLLLSLRRSESRLKLRRRLRSRTWLSSLRWATWMGHSEQKPSRNRI